MKLDKIKFAQLVNYLGRRGVQMDSEEIVDLDNIIDIEVPEPIEHHCYPKNDNVEALMKHMAAGVSKIEAIKEHRAITGMGLKESKDAVERYWIKPNRYSYSELNAKLQDNLVEFSSAEQSAIFRFLNKL